MAHSSCSVPVSMSTCICDDGHQRLLTLQHNAAWSSMMVSRGLADHGRGGLQVALTAASALLCEACMTQVVWAHGVLI